MSLVDWNEVEPEWKWVIGDKEGVCLFTDEPMWDEAQDGFVYTNGRLKLVSTNAALPPIKEPRPTNAASDPLSALWLYNLEVKKGNKFNGYDRSDLIQLIHALVKELDGNQKPNPTD